MWFYQEKLNMFLYKRNNKILLKKKKKSDLLLCKVKKEWFFQEKKIRFVFRKKKDFLKEDSHSWGEFIMHASQIKKAIT